MKCPACGAKHSPTAVLCPSCGISLEKSGETAPGEAPTLEESQAGEWHLETPTERKSKKRALIVTLIIVVVLAAGGAAIGYWRATSSQKRAEEEAQERNKAINETVDKTLQLQKMESGLTGDKAAVEKAAMEYARTSSQIPLGNQLQPDGTDFITTDRVDVYIKDLTNGKRYRVSVSRTGPGGSWTASMMIEWL